MKAIVRAICIAVLVGNSAWAGASSPVSIQSRASDTDGARKNGADVGMISARKHELPMPHRPSPLPPTQAERKYDLPSSDRLRPDTGERIFPWLMLNQCRYAMRRTEAMRSDLPLLIAALRERNGDKDSDTRAAVDLLKQIQTGRTD